MRMLGVGIGDARLSRAVCLRSGVECAHPPNLVSAIPFAAPAFRLGPRFVASASTPASIAETFFGTSPVRTCVNSSAKPVHSCTSLNRSGTSTNGYISLISAFSAAALAVGVMINVPASRRTPSRHDPLLAAIALLKRLHAEKRRTVEVVSASA